MFRLDPWNSFRVFAVGEKSFERQLAGLDAS